MSLSLQKRFLLFLLLPVAAILVIAGFAGFLFARGFLLEQWVEATHLKLERAALQIQNQLNAKIELIRLIAKAEDIPNKLVTQSFLIQQLTDMPGVKFVDIEDMDLSDRDLKEIGKSAEDYGPGLNEGLYTIGICEDLGYCSPVLHPGAADRSLRIVRILGDPKRDRLKRLLVRIDFDSLLGPIMSRIGVRGAGSACLVTSTGQYLAHTDKSKAHRERLGETGNLLEKKLKDAIAVSEAGHVSSGGHPPETVVGYYKVPTVNWYLVLYASGREIMEPIVRFRFFYALAGAAVLFLILGLIRVTTRNVARQVGAISQAAARVSDGDYSVKLKAEGALEIAQLTASFNEMIEGLKQRDLIERTFGRYVDSKVAKELMKSPEALDLGGKKRLVTMLMADLRGFTSVAEKLSPEEVIRMLNRHFALSIAVIETYRGIVVDFFGDAVLVFFDGFRHDYRARALDAVKCAMEMQERHEELLRAMVSEGFPELRLGIGVHTGEVIVGNIGTETRAKYGIVGSDVNLTARIQSVAGAGKVVVSQETYRLLDGLIKVSGDFRVCLKGLEGDRELYEVESLTEGAYGAPPKTL
jgi:class 3 adenylate cyclase